MQPTDTLALRVAASARGLSSQAGIMCSTMYAQQKLQEIIHRSLSSTVQLHTCHCDVSKVPATKASMSAERVIGQEQQHLQQHHTHSHWQAASS